MNKRQQNQHWYNETYRKWDFGRKVVRKAKAFSYNHFGTSKLHKILLDKLTQQGHQCAITGLYICPLKHASLDHIDSIKTHPEKRTDLNNIQWVDAAINRAKGSMAPEVFEEWLFRLYVALDKKFGHLINRENNDTRTKRESTSIRRCA